MPQSEYKVTLGAALVISVWPMVPIFKFSPADLPYPPSSMGLIRHTHRINSRRSAALQ